MNVRHLLVSLCCIALVQGFGPFPINKNEISVSGLSSGAFAAVQLHVAFSEMFMGAAIFAGGPFYCAQDSVETAFEECMFAIDIDVQNLVSQTSSFASQGNIDATSNLEKSRVYLYSGTSDTVVFPAVMKSLLTYYQSFISNNSQIVTEFDIPSEHCLPTDSYGSSCATLGSPYINNCDYDGAGKALNTIYHNLKPRVSQNTNNIVSFSQSTYMPSDWTVGEASLAETGYAYVPTGCQSAARNVTCKLHVSLHGCQQTTDDIGNDFYTDGGFNEWAEANNIIVIYPQAVKSYFDPSNPEGCFDWWGYTNSNYAFQSGPQMAFVANLIKAISA